LFNDGLDEIFEGEDFVKNGKGDRLGWLKKRRRVVKDSGVYKVP